MHSSKIFKYVLVVRMSNWSTYVLYRFSFPRVTFRLWAAALYWWLVWLAHAKFIGPNVFAGIYFWLPNDLVFVHLEVDVAMKVLGPEIVNRRPCRALISAQHALLVEHTNHVPARLLVHQNIIAALVLFKQDFMRPAVGPSSVLHVEHSSAA